MPYIEIEINKPAFIRQYREGHVVVVAEVSELEYAALKKRVDGHDEQSVVSFEFLVN